VLGAIRRRLTYANVTATLALVLAMSAGAWAAFSLPRNSVRSLNIKNGQVKARDIGNNQVRSSDIKNGQVKSDDIRDGDVTSADIGAGQVKGANIGSGEVSSANIGAGQVLSGNIGSGQVGANQLAQPEPFHLVGSSAAEPTFGDGGQGDCVWRNVDLATGVPSNPFNPTGFYKDPFGVVHLTGAAQSSNGGSGHGDGMCGTGGGQDTLDDATVFILPPEDRPPNELRFAVGGVSGLSNLIVNGTQPVDPGSGTIAPGAVLLLSGSNTNFDGVDFRAAGTGTGIP